MESIDVRYEEVGGSIGLRYGIIEVTTSCPCRCPGCYMVRRNELNGKQMTLGQAIKVLDLCRDYCGRELESMDILGGEPLTWRFLKPYIEALLKRGIKPWIFSNLIPATPEIAAWLFERRVHVTGKLNINPDDPKQLQVQAKMLGKTVKTAKRMIAGIEIFRQAGYQDPLLRLENLIRRDNLPYIPEYYEWCLEQDIGTDIELLACGEGIDDNYWKLAPSPIELAKVIKQIQGIRKGRGLEKKAVLMPHIHGRCAFYDKGLYFGVDGHIRACSNSNRKLSDVGRPDAIRQAWESKLLRDRRSLTKENILEPCRSCGTWEQCQGGCRATAEGSGDNFAGYPLCPVPFM